MSEFRYWSYEVLKKPDFFGAHWERINSSTEPLVIQGVVADAFFCLNKNKETIHNHVKHKIQPIAWSMFKTFIDHPFPQISVLATHSSLFVQPSIAYKKAYHLDIIESLSKADHMYKSYLDSKLESTLVDYLDYCVDKQDILGFYHAKKLFLQNNFVLSEYWRMAENLLREDV